MISGSASAFPDIITSGTTGYDIGSAVHSLYYNIVVAGYMISGSAVVFPVL